MEVALALAAAVCYAAAIVLQQHSARAVDPDGSLHPGVVVRLATKPLWLAGAGANLAGYGLRFAALGRGSIVVVQPLLVTSLLFALPMSARWHREPLRKEEAAAALAVVVGLSLFLVMCGRDAGRSTASRGAWLATSASFTLVAALLVGRATHHRGDRRAALLAAGGGVLLALGAALTKAVASQARARLFSPLHHGQAYALVVVVAAAVVVVQSAFGAAPITRSLPMLMVVELLMSVVIGIALFDEHVRSGLAPRVAELGGLGLLATGIAVLAADRQGHG